MAESRRWRLTKDQVTRISQRKMSPVTRKKLAETRIALAHRLVQSAGKITRTRCGIDVIWGEEGLEALSCFRNSTRFVARQSIEIFGSLKVTHRLVSILSSK